MRKQTFAIILLLLPILTTWQVNANDLTGNVGVSIYGGVAIPTNGDYSGDIKATDLLNVGPQFGLGVSYFFTQGFGVEISGNYGFNNYQDDYKTSGKEPVLSNLSFSINGIYNFGHMLDNSIVSPVARVGIGIYNWSHLDDGIDGDVVKVDLEEFKASSFGFNVGVGADFNVASNFTIGIIFDYNMYLAEDKDKFGDVFAEQGYLTSQMKFTYYFPTSK